MADEEALAVVVGVDEPAGDAVRIVAADLAGLRVEHVHALEAHPHPVPFHLLDCEVRLAEDDEEVPLAGVPEVVRHVEVGVHPGLEDREAAEFRELARVRVVGEGARHQHIEARFGGLPRGGGEIRTRDGPELGPDQDSGAALPTALLVAPLRRDELAGPGVQRGELDPILPVRLLDARRPQVVEDHRGEVPRLPRPGARPRGLANELPVLVHREGAVGSQALHGERPGHPDPFLILERLVVEHLVVRLPGDGVVDLLLAADAGLPECGKRLPRPVGPVARRLPGDLPLQKPVPRRRVSVRKLDRSRGRREVHRLPLPRPARDEERRPVSPERVVQAAERSLDGGLPLLIDRVDLSVVRNGPKSDVRNRLVDESMPDIAARLTSRTLLCVCVCVCVCV